LTSIFHKVAKRLTKEFNNGNLSGFIWAIGTGLGINLNNNLGENPNSIKAEIIIGSDDFTDGILTASF
jgi:hypothetical protein